MPCGIYGDSARFDALDEHFTTIDKAMKKIAELSNSPDPNDNQIVRWVNTKEDHANEIVEILRASLQNRSASPSSPIHPR